MIGEWGRLQVVTVTAWAGRVGGGVCSDSGREGRELRNWRREEVDLVHSQVWDEKERKC